MSVQVIARAPQARCYQCGSPEIANVCHHCGRAMCPRHSPKAIVPLTIEFTELGLKDSKAGENPIHCEFCDHIVRPPNTIPIVLGIVIVLTGLGGIGVLAGSALLARQLTLAVLAFLSISGLGVLLWLFGGIALIFLGYKWKQHQETRIRDSRPALPLLPRFDPIKVRETVNGRVALAPDGTYRATVAQLGGELTIVTNLAKPERDRLQQYRAKYRLSDDEPVSFHAGFAALHGPAELTFVGDSENASRVFPLRGQLSDLPWFSAGGRGSSEWRITRKYKLLEPAEMLSLPVRLVPSLVQESAQRALDLEVQWVAPDSNPETPGLTIERIDLLELDVPFAWGEVENVGDNALIGRSADVGGIGAMRTITWRRLPLTEDDRKNQRRTFFVRFENEIDLACVIRGRIEVAFKTALSHLQNVVIYYPLGGPREQEARDIETHVHADFELSLAGLRYQDVRVIPDPKQEKDRDKAETQTFEGVIPDHSTVIALTNAMSSQGLYVKWVIENPPRTGERANRVNRSWDIAGRHYLGVYPIDYHLVLTGEEVYGGEIRAQAGTTKTALTVQGTYANPDMEAQIENVWEHLTHLIGETMQQLPHSMPVGQPSVAPTPTVQPPAPPPRDTERADRLATLRQRLDQLTDALLTGRLSESTFLGLKQGIDQEMQALQSGA